MCKCFFCFVVIARDINFAFWAYFRHLFFWGFFFKKRKKEKKKEEAFMSFFRWAYPIFELNALVNCNMKIQN